MRWRRAYHPGRHPHGGDPHGLGHVELGRLCYYDHATMYASATHDHAHDFWTSVRLAPLSAATREKIQRVLKLHHTDYVEQSRTGASEVPYQRLTNALIIDEGVPRDVLKALYQAWQKRLDEAKAKTNKEFIASRLEKLKLWPFCDEIKQDLVAIYTDGSNNPFGANQLAVHIAAGAKHLIEAFDISRDETYRADQLGKKRKIVETVHEVTERLGTLVILTKDEADAKAKVVAREKANGVKYGAGEYRLDLPVIFVRF